MDIVIALLVILLAWWLIASAEISLWFLVGVVALVALVVYIVRNVDRSRWT